MTHTPVFQDVLGNADWQRLGAVVRRHYGLRPWSDDRMTVRGRMDEVWSSAIWALCGAWIGGTCRCRCTCCWAVPVWRNAPWRATRAPSR